MSKITLEEIVAMIATYCVEGPNAATDSYWEAKEQEVRSTELSRKTSLAKDMALSKSVFHRAMGLADIIAALQIKDIMERRDILANNYVIPKDCIDELIELVLHQGVDFDGVYERGDDE